MLFREIPIYLLNSLIHLPNKDDKHYIPTITRYFVNSP